VEKCGNPEESETIAECPLAACSACAGDYEDPDRTAWNADESDQATEAQEALEVEKEREFAAIDRNESKEQTRPRDSGEEQR